MARAIPADGAEDRVDLWVLEKCHDFLGAVFVGRGHEACFEKVPGRLAEPDVVPLFCEEVDSCFEREGVCVAGGGGDADGVCLLQPGWFDDFQRPA